jgi:protein-tyrosine-phosphatase
MTPDHRDEIFSYQSPKSDNVYTLKGYLRKKPPENETIDDPYGLSLNFYRRIYKEIETEISRIFPQLVKNAQKSIPDV